MYINIPLHSFNYILYQADQGHPGSLKNYVVYAFHTFLLAPIILIKSMHVHRRLYAFQDSVE